MQEYRSKVKIGTLMARGITDQRLLRTRTALDTSIVSLAGRVLSTSETFVFFLLYDCVPTWDESIKLLKECGKKYNLETVRTYAAEAGDKIARNANKSNELAAWQKNYSK